MVAILRLLRLIVHLIPQLFPLHFTLKETHLLGFLLVHQEVDHLAFVAELALAVRYLCVEVDEVAHLFIHLGADCQFGFVGRDRFAELHVQLHGIAARLHFAGDDPSAHLVDQCAQNASVHRVDPALVILAWMPGAHDVIPILVEAQMEADRVVGATAEAVVAGVIIPWIDNLF